MSLRVTVVHSFYRSGASGENAVVHAETAALSRAGVTIRLVSAHGSDIHGPWRTLGAGVRVATQRGASPRRALRAWRPDVVHVHNLFPSWASRWMASSSSPVVATLHNYRPLCANGLLLRNGRPCTECLDRSPLSGLRHACYRDSRLATLPLTLRQVLHGIADPHLREPVCLLLPSAQAAEVYASAGLDTTRIRVNEPFLPDDTAPAEVSLSGRSGFVFVGRLSVEKGLQEVLPVWPEDERLVVVGDGPLRPTLERLAPSSVRFVGSLSRRDSVALLGTAEALLFPSLALETFGLVYLEALAAATPVIASHRTVVGGLVAAHGTGSTVNRWQQLPEHLRAVRAAGTELRGHCRRVFEDRYSERLWTRRRLALYEEVVGAHH